MKSLTGKSESIPPAPNCRYDSAVPVPKPNIRELIDDYAVRRNAMNNCTEVGCNFVERCKNCEQYETKCEKIIQTIEELCNTKNI